MKKWLPLTLALLSSGYAGAVTVELRLSTATGGVFGTGYYDDLKNVGWSITTSGGTLSSVYSGLLWVEERTPPDLYPDPKAPIALYCVSPFDQLGRTNPWKAVKTVDTGLSPPFSVQQERALSWLVNYDVGYDAATAGKAAAVQLAIWRVVAGPVFTITAPPDYTGIKTLSNDLFHTAMGQNQLHSYVFYNNSTEPQYSQDLIGRGPNPPQESIPEPFTLALGAGGLALAALRRRRA